MRHAPACHPPLNCHCAAMTVTGACFHASCDALNKPCSYIRCNVTMQSAGDSELLSAVFPDIDEVKLPLVAMMHERGPACFDFEYYRSLNTDLQQYATDEQLWGHFLHFGQFERRPFRYHTVYAANHRWLCVLISLSLPLSSRASRSSCCNAPLCGYSDEHRAVVIKPEAEIDTVVDLGRFTCDWDPPAGHDWAGYPIRSDNAAALSDAEKVTDPKQRRRSVFSSWQSSEI